MSLSSTLFLLSLSSFSNGLDCIPSFCSNSLGISALVSSPFLSSVLKGSLASVFRPSLASLSESFLAFVSSSLSSVLKGCLVSVFPLFLSLVSTRSWLLHSTPSFLSSFSTSVFSPSSFPGLEDFQLQCFLRSQFQCVRKYYYPQLFYQFVYFLQLQCFPRRYFHFQKVL